MYTFLLILMIIIAILLIIVVLVQPGKGDMVTGMGTIGTSITSMFGSRRAADMLTKITIGLAVSLMLLVIVTNKFFVGNHSVEATKAITEGVALPTKSNPVPLPTPNKGTQPQQQENKK